MSLREDTMDRPPMDRSQASEPAPTNKRIQRLYPSLPNVDNYDICLQERSNHRDSAEFHPEARLEDTQSEAPTADNDRLKARILILEEQKQELISINEKWAKEYRTMARYYRDKIRDLKALLQQDHTHFEEGTFNEEETRMTLCKKMTFKTLKDIDVKQTCDSDMKSKFIKVEKEAEELRVQNSTLTRRGQHQHEEIQRLNKALQEALKITEPLEVSSETQQELWKHQAEVYKEDFLTERKDREKLKGKYLELENRFRKVRHELHVLKSQVTCNPTPQAAMDCVCSNQVKCQNWEVQPTVNQNKAQLQKRHT